MRCRTDAGEPSPSLGSRLIRSLSSTRPGGSPL